MSEGHDVAVTSAAPTEGLSVARPLTVAWLGTKPSWLEHEAAAAALEPARIEWVWAGFSPSEIDGRGSPLVIHVAPDGVDTVAGLRRAFPHARIVADLGGRTQDGDPAAGLAAASADAVLVSSPAPLQALALRAPSLAARLRVVPPILDLDLHAPEQALLRSRDRGPLIKRFRRFHRLGVPTVLTVGPYTEAGGLDLALELAFRLRERFEGLRLAAIPLGAVDQRYLDSCEMRALGLGHRGIVEWTVSAPEIPFWYATATVVCAPWREPGPADPARFAAAAARPFVGSALEPFRTEVAEGETGFLVAAGDLAALENAVGSLLAQPERAGRIGEAGQRQAETQWGPGATAQRLLAVWSELASSDVERAAATNGKPHPA